MKFRLSTKIFTAFVALFIIVILILSYIRIDKEIKLYDDAFKVENLNQGQTISTEYTKTTQIDEHSN
jgi:uncharacterized membrane protein YciS (DUF1049 family)